jgi:hypothetical protein
MNWKKVYVVPTGALGKVANFANVERNKLKARPLPRLASFSINLARMDIVALSGLIILRSGRRESSPHCRNPQPAGAVRAYGRAPRVDFSDGLGYQTLAGAAVACTTRRTQGVYS